MTKVTMEKIQSLAKQRGFIFPSSEIYGGFANTWDYGPLGVELKNNIKNSWWKHFVHDREDMVGLDSAIILNPKVWEASGHVEEFADLLIDCKQCKVRLRADHVVEEQTGKNVEGLKPEQIDAAIKESNVKCPSCNSMEWTSARPFNNLFRTFVGPLEEDRSVAYLRGETAQGIFIDFKMILESTRKRIPFGVGQIGKSFRNEITTGNYIFRTREFEIAELEYFINPKTDWETIFNDWLSHIYKFSEKIGIAKKNIHENDLLAEKRAHYSKKTIDLYYDYPFGASEMWAIAYRTDYDLSRHQKYSGVDMSYTDPITQEKYIPHVIEPTFGVDRTILAVLLSAYDEEEIESANGKKEKRVVLRFKKELAPYKIAILPLSKNPELSPKAKEIFDLLKKNFVCDYDETQSIGKRYRRQDEIGTPYCVTIDFETLKDNAVTVRDRDTMKQDRIKIEELDRYLSDKLK
ncbi:glycine--tRNA ligase [bacterium CG_4_10_14_0_2_um_filter_33_32]|nr:MAG: glycine--tRNA ligase [bacterium CG2_30_33_46]PIU77015.1 MAG: glycine--tRNA ligase [bacterium CG06_land_8_20_14_3_00_33_50]PIW81748.1 MAG: glycine--tRNA ligase [bacterium CG_4_8_14_3_um_filter_33_28]PIY85828.1 MAG: glycine--tRNA ligase [bacterium CG_4_10_14_0_8_um_filter_33_57]PIZ85461.1 MAG: glycine--tRNA ligase [bacterium CG_4_10_14_0_2_um_filter_33_32]PJA72042.1 MAG: glycine--tRNA ligase [bacterium CG_4_9_14_3_um_filter_33_26]